MLNISYCNSLLNFNLSIRCNLITNASPTRRAEWRATKRATKRAEWRAPVFFARFCSRRSRFSRNFAPRFRFFHGILLLVPVFSRNFASHSRFFRGILLLIPVFFAEFCSSFPLFSELCSSLPYFSRNFAPISCMLTRNGTFSDSDIMPADA